ncbi:amidoligase family protein [Actinoplanes sp. NPDC024001]|uniref:amidoligase family protein n=1 Tax=Actinoplanes sp. NPDC024001 TaxID=3154598 RepID=UPI0033C797B4
MTARLRRRIGFEIELMAPPGVSRRTLAFDLAGRCGGTVRPVWHHDSEPSLVPGLGRFLHLTQAFEVRRPDGALLCTLADDVTLLAGLAPSAPAIPGWFRILTDDRRLLRLLAAQCDPGGSLKGVLDPAARLWDTAVQRHGPVYRLDDEGGATIALAAPLTGERERPCEVITPPLASDHHKALAELLEPARELGFTVPREAAVHLHLDGGPFREPAALANLVRLFAYWREPLRALLATNPACRRLAPLPGELVAAVSGTPTTEQLRRAAKDGGLTKFFDVNLTQVLTDTPPVRDTVEIRILPGAIDAGEIVDRAALAELLVERCLAAEPVPPAPEDPQDAAAGLLELAAEALASRDQVG